MQIVQLFFVTFVKLIFRLKPTSTIGDASVVTIVWHYINSIIIIIIIIIILTLGRYIPEGV